MKKEKNARSFSYLDVFLILIFCLVLSFVIYHFTEKARLREQTPNYLVELSAKVSEIQFEPKNGEALYRENGEIYGEVQSVQTEKEGSAEILILNCQMQGVSLQEGEEYRLETESGICRMQVKSVREIPKS